MRLHHREFHRIDRVGWLRAAVLGANDGLISTSSLVVGVAAANVGTTATIMAALAGLVGGALSMGAGEFVSVSSQADSEHADLAREKHELATTPEAEHRELAGIYVQRGLSPGLADQVATQLAEHDALAAHARDELGITETQSRAAGAGCRCFDGVVCLGRGRAACCSRCWFRRTDWPVWCLAARWCC